MLSETKCHQSTLQSIIGKLGWPVTDKGVKMLTKKTNETFETNITNVQLDEYIINNNHCLGTSRQLFKFDNHLTHR